VADPALGSALVRLPSVEQVLRPVRTVGVSTPAWYDELPQAMSEAEYRALPEEVARTIEVVHGHVIRCESPSPRHNRIARRLAGALEAVRTPEGVNWSTFSQL
jgi:hypothetical protein